MSLNGEMNKKEAIQRALDLWPIKIGEVELNVSVNGSHAN